MAAYWAMRIKAKKETLGLTAAQAYYRQIFTMEIYKEYKAETDLILTTEGNGDCIVAI